MPLNLKSLTSLRFFAAMWVVAYHFWPNLGLPMPAVVAKGYLGVELFFVLSGFILCHVYLEGFGQGRFNYRAFLWARLARIYPVHLAVLLGLMLLIAAAALVGISAGDKMLVWSSLPAQLTLTQAWGLSPLGGWNHPSWSISAEWFAYLTFPIFAFVAWRLVNRPRMALVLALGLVVALNIGFQHAAGFSLTQATILWGALRIVPCFALGCAVWLSWRADLIGGKVAGLGLALVALVGVVAAALLHAPDYVAVALFGALILGLAAISTSGSSLLAQPLLVYLGEVSFAVYMVCIPWESVFTQGLGKVLALEAEHMPITLWLALYIGVIPVAMVLHHAVERPMRTLMRRHGPPFGRVEAAPAPAPANA